MNSLVKAVSDVVPDARHASQVKKNNCRVSLASLARARLTLDLDCETLGVSDQKRCDYLVACAKDGKEWVALLGAKGRPASIQATLSSNSRVAQSWLTGGSRETAEFTSFPYWFTGRGCTGTMTGGCVPPASPGGIKRSVSN